MSAALSPAVPATPPHILMTLDAVGGVWRYAMDLAAGMVRHGFAFTFVGLGPAPTPAQRAEAERIGQLIWLDAPLDWLAETEAQLDRMPDVLAALVEQQRIDLVHLNLPSQACGLALPVPTIVVSHSCVVTWFAAVRQDPLPADWQWQLRRNRAGFDAADMVLAPSQAHADLLRLSYGPIENLSVVHNAWRASIAPTRKHAKIFAAGRWWDEGKNGALLDKAARCSVWPVAMAGACTGPNGQKFHPRNACSLGELPHAAVAQAMAEAAIVASPSRYEPFGLAALEGAKAGAALVLADIPTYRELWDGAALFAAPDDAAGFAHALNRLAGDDALRHEFAALARQRSARFAPEAQCAAMRAVYGRLLQSPSELEA